MRAMPAAMPAGPTGELPVAGSAMLLAVVDADVVLGVCEVEAGPGGELTLVAEPDVTVVLVLEVVDGLVDVGPPQSATGGLAWAQSVVDVVGTVQPSGGRVAETEMGAATNESGHETVTVTV